MGVTKIKFMKRKYYCRLLYVDLNSPYFVNMISFASPTMMQHFLHPYSINEMKVYTNRIYRFQNNILG